MLQSKPLRVKTKSTKTIAPTKASSSTSFKIYDENIAPVSKVAAKRVGGTKRTILGEITTRNNVAKKDSKAAASLTKRPPLTTKSIAPAATKNQQVKPKVSVAKPEEVPRQLLPKPSSQEVESTELDDLLDCDVDQKMETEPMEIESFKDHFLDPVAASSEVLDIDEEAEDDPQFCTEYVQLIMKYLHKKEVENKVAPDLMANQAEINERHRTILVDWICEVCAQLRLLTETVFLAVFITDRFLQSKQVAKSKLQLVGVTAMLIAAKFEEMYTPEVDDFVFMASGAYDHDEVLKMERLMLVTLDFNLSFPTPLHFLRRYSRAAFSDTKMHNLSKYLSELSLLEINMLHFVPSQVAAASVYIARKMCGHAEAWTRTLEYYSGYKEEDILNCAQQLNAIKHGQVNSKHQATTRKFESDKLSAAASIPAVHF